MTGHGTPIYRFEVPHPARNFTIVWSCMWFAPVAIGLWGLLGKCFSGDFPSFSDFLNWLTMLVFSGGVGWIGLYIVRRKLIPEIVTCYADGIDLSKHGFLRKDQMRAVHLRYNTGSHKRGTVLIHTSAYLLKLFYTGKHGRDFLCWGSAYICDNLPNAQAVYQKLRSLYTLPDRDLDVVTVWCPSNVFDSSGGFPTLPEVRILERRPDGYVRRISRGRGPVSVLICGFVVLLLLVLMVVGCMALMESASPPSVVTFKPVDTPSKSAYSEQYQR